MDRMYGRQVDHSECITGVVSHAHLSKTQGAMGPSSVVSYNVKKDVQLWCTAGG